MVPGDHLGTRGLFFPAYSCSVNHLLTLNNTHMQVITITTDAYMQLIDKIDAIASNMNQITKENPLTETWLDTLEVCQILKISKRTLQSYRDNGTLPFSQVSGKIYFKASDLEKHLENHYKPSFNK